MVRCGNAVRVRAVRRQRGLIVRVEAQQPLFRMSMESTSLIG